MVDLRVNPGQNAKAPGFFHVKHDDNVPGSSIDSFGNIGGFVSPESLGVVGWAFDPAVVGNGKAAVLGTVYLSKICVPRPRLCTTLWWGLNAAVNTPTAAQNFVGLLGGDGRLITSVDVTSVAGSTGLMNSVPAKAFTPDLGDNWFVFLFNGVSAGQPYRGGDLNASLMNLSVAATGRTLRFATTGTGQTALSATGYNPDNFAVAQFSYWAAIG